jgi:MoaA/NifB/PqqE/SkfB family radical SAM enzyme
MLHNLCNQHCSYCPGYNHDGTHGWPKYDEVVGFLERVFAHYRKDLYHVSFTGGEPTLWPELPRLCAYLKEKKCELGMTSNGANTLTFWEKISGSFNTISLSYHPEFARNAHFLDVIRIASSRSEVGVRLMMPAQKPLWDKCVAFSEMIKAASFTRKVFVEFVPLQEELGVESRLVPYEAWQTEFFAETPTFHVGPDASPEEFLIRSEADVWAVDSVYDDGSRAELRLSDFMTPESIDFFGWECRVGLDQIFIAQDGWVFRAGCHEGGRLGQFSDPALAFPVLPISCRRNACPCGTDIMTPKWNARPAPFRLRFLLNPFYLAGRLRTIGSSGELLERVQNLFRYVRDRFEAVYYVLEGFCLSKIQACREVVLHERETEFRLRNLLNPFFVARRLRETRSLDDLRYRAGNVFRVADGRLEKMFYDLTGRCLPGIIEGKKAVVHRVRSLLSAQEDMLLDARLRRSEGRFLRRIRARGAAAELVPNPVSPMERHPPCRINLSWNIHVACNYDCTYCWFHGHWAEFEEQNRYLPAEDWKRHWERFNARYGPAKIDIAGGEPFTYPGFLDILENVGKKNVVLISTNLSWGVERFIERIDPSRVEISASFHPMYTSAPVILEKILRLRRAGFHANVSLVAYPLYLHQLLDIADLFISRGIYLDVQPFRGTWKGRIYPDAYTPAAKELLERLMNGSHIARHYPAHPEEKRANRVDTSPLAIEYQLGRKTTRGVRCNAGVLYGRLQANGVMTRCAQGGLVGNFFDEGFRMGEEAEPCPFKFCDCINEVVHIEGAPRGPAPLVSAPGAA